MNLINREKIATLCLVLGTLFCPIGYDAIFRFTMDVVGSYWLADIVFYCISFFFLILYCFLSKINPITHIKTKLTKNE
jgi:hypothetical protein